MKQMIKVYVMVMCILLLICTKLVIAQDTLQRMYLMPPYKGQISGYSDWTIPPDAWNELTNCYVDEQGKIVMRPGFYCWKDSVSTTESVLGAYDYTKQVEGGAITYFIFNTDERLYRTTRDYSASNTNISGGLSFSDDSIPQFDIFYNMLFMANGENLPIMYDQDSNAIEVGRSIYSGAVVFEDTNEIVTDDGTYFDTVDYHFRGGMDLVVSDSNNNGTYEIVSVDSNVIIIKNTDGTAVTLVEESDSNVLLTGLGTPDSLSDSRTETIILTDDNIWGHDNGTNDYFQYYGGDWYASGFRAGMNIEVSGIPYNEGNYTVQSISASNMYVGDANIVNNELISGIYVTVTGTQQVATGDGFVPTCLAGHKGRLFAGGCKEFPTYLFWSRSKYATAYFYDLWRDRFGQDDGTGYYDMQDKVVALVPNYNGMLVVFCSRSIWFIRGDDPGFDILTPNQGYVFQPVPVTREIGIIGPNAWERIGNEIFFYSEDGLQQLSMAAQQGTLGANLISLPIRNIHKTITNDMTLKKTTLKFLPDLNILFMLFRGTYTSTLDSLLLCYNLSNNAFSTFEFPVTSEPVCLFKADGFNEDPNVSDIVYREADPARTLWFGSEDGKLFSLHKGFPYDLDYEDTGNASLNNITMTAITSKLNMGQPFLEKNFERTVFLCSPQLNYDWAALGKVSFYKKIDNGSWSSAVEKTFSLHGGDAVGTPIDYYEYLDAGVGFKGRGKSIQYKIEVSGLNGRHGLEFVGAMTEWLPMDYRI